MDGDWYTVDVTWMDAYDQTGVYYSDWFMADTDTVNKNDQDSAHVLSSSAVLVGYPVVKLH